MQLLLNFFSETQKHGAIVRIGAAGGKLPENRVFGDGGNPREAGKSRRGQQIGKLYERIFISAVTVNDNRHGARTVSAKGL